MRIDVLGVGFDNLTMTEAVSRGAALLEEPGCHYVVTPNPEIVEVCRENPAAMQAVNGADLVLPDGIGVVKGAAMLGTPLKEKTPGIEFAAGLMGKMAERGRSLYLLGAKPGVADMAAERLQKQYPGLKIAGTHDGYFKEDAPVVEAIRESGADCVFVCLGMVGAGGVGYVISNSLQGYDYGTAGVAILLVFLVAYCIERVFVRIKKKFY